MIAIALGYAAGFLTAPAIMSAAFLSSTVRAWYRRRRYIAALRILSRAQGGQS
jgi:uncharacterized protein YjiS (DUF1127 family)